MEADRIREIANELAASNPSVCHELHRIAERVRKIERDWQDACAEAEVDRNNLAHVVLDAPAGVN